jgi:hypothetical protein
MHAAKMDDREYDEGIPTGLRVYFIEAHDGAIKVGVARNPMARLRNLQVGQAHALTLLGTIPGDAVDEKRLHHRFSKYHMRGEWYGNEIKPLAEWLIARERRRIDGLAEAA